MKTYAILNAGEIIRTQSCSQDAVDAEQAINPGYVFIEIPILRGVSEIFFDGQAVVDRPFRPENFFRWDAANKQWVDPRTLQDLKNAKWSQIKQARAAATSALIATPSGVFDANEQSQQSIERATRLAEQTNATVGFTLSNNQVVMLDAAALNQVGLMLGQREQAARNKATGLRAQIDAATTAAALDLVVW